MCIKSFKEMEKDERQCCICTLTFVICFLVSIGLIVGGFFVPPTGVIDGSVLTAVGELIFFPTILYGYRAIELGLAVRMQHGDNVIEIGKKEE